MFILGVVLFVIGIPLLLIPIVGIPLMLVGALLMFFGFLQSGMRLGLGVGKIAAKGAAQASRAAASRATTKICPDCAGRLPKTANVCLRCAYRFAPSPDPASLLPQAGPNWPKQDAKAR